MRAFRFPGIRRPLAVMRGLMPALTLLLAAPVWVLAEQGNNNGMRAAMAPAELASLRDPVLGQQGMDLATGDAAGLYPESLLAAFQGNGEPGWMGWLGLAVLTLVCAGGVTWFHRKPQGVNTINSPGFEVISPTEPRQFIPLQEQTQQLDFITGIKTHGDLRLSANLNKVSLSVRRYGYLMEDKNYRNALLVNRRRVRRTLLRDGDVLDLGDLTLLYRDNRDAPFIRRSAVTPPDGKVVIKFNRTRTPVRKGTPMLVSEQYPNRQFYISKNLVFIGRSESNDLVIKSQEVEYRHAKIERVGARYKIQDLSGFGATYVNNRRVEQRFLKEGDEISIDSNRFKYQIVTRPVRERGAPQDRQNDMTTADNGQNGDDTDSDTEA